MARPTTPQARSQPGSDAYAVEHGVDGGGETKQGEGAGDVEASVEGAHGVFGLVRGDDEDADDARR